MPTHTQPADDVDRTELRQELAHALAKGGMVDVHVISHETAENVLTPRRREIIRTLKQKEVESVRGLARTLGRDKGAVSRDLSALADSSIITYETDGRAKRPVLVSEHVVIEPIT